jgi:hypothetical protein
MPGEYKPKIRQPLTNLQAFGVVVSLFAGVAGLGFTVFLALAWFAWETHRFGQRDLRYLVFVRGTLIERVGIIDAQPGTLRYIGQGRDGNAPGYLRAHYTSQADAEALFGRLLERCRSLKLTVREGDPAASEGERSASCGREAANDYHVHFSVRSGRPTEVFMGEDIDDGLYASR